MDRHGAWFRRLLRLLPSDFQADYAADMERTFQAQQRMARQEGAGGVIRLWTETIADLLRTAPREHAEQFAQDFGYAVRMLRRTPTAALAAIATMAVGIGGVTAIVSVVSGVDWRPLAYPDAARVVFVGERLRGQPVQTTGYATFVDWRARAAGFDELAAIGSTQATLTNAAEPERVTGLRVTSGYFRVIGISPALGRAFTDAEQRWSNRRAVILSARLWRSRFGGDPAVVGRSLRLDGIEHLVAGVMPDGIEDLLGQRLYEGADIWLPLAYDEALPSACRTCRHLRVIGRLARSASIAEAEAEVDAIMQRLGREHPTAYVAPGAHVERVADVLLGPVRPGLYALLAAAVLLLLIATVNVSNLLLVRAVERGPEIATRRALGVATGRLARQLFTESVVLAGAGGACGVAVAYGAVRAFVSLAPASVPRLDQVSVDGTALLVAGGVACGAGVAFGMLPVWHLVRTDAMLLLRGGRVLVAGGGRAGRALVAVNVAIAVVLLSATALLGRSLIVLLRVDPGFEPRGVVTASIALGGPAYDTVDARNAFARELLRRVAGEDEVAALTTQLPTAPNDSAGLHIEGRLLANPGAAPSADRFGVTPEYFRAMRIPLLRGRTFTDHDREGAQLVALVNRAVAERLFPGTNPIGRRIVLGGPDGPRREIVGVVGDVRHRGLSEPVSYQVYVPLAQFGGAPVVLALRTTSSEAEATTRIRSAVAAMDPSQMAYGIRSFEAIVAGTLGERRFLLGLIGAFAAAALLLAVVGLYGVVAYVVAQRRRDLGLRMALGAGRGDIRRLVLRIGMVPVAAGLVVGALLAAAVTPVTRPLLYAVDPFDARALGIVIATMMASALIACYVPARRATRLDPVAALRGD